VFTGPHSVDLNKIMDDSSPLLSHDVEETFSPVENHILSSRVWVDAYTIFFRAAFTGEEVGSLCVGRPSGWSYAAALRSVNLNPLDYTILQEDEVLDPNQVLADKNPLRLKKEDFDEQCELHLQLVRVAPKRGSSVTIGEIDEGIRFRSAGRPS